MTRFALLLAVAILPACTNDAPPPGALTVQAAYPMIGTTWVMHESDSSTNKSGNYRYGAVSATYHDAPAYGVQSGSNIDILNPQTFNFMANILNGKQTATITPDDGRYSWPLWVGKSWSVNYKAESASGVNQFGFYRKVTAYEDVTVPAGTIKAFRIESSPLQGVDPGYRLTQWYAPSVAYIVRSDFSLSGRAEAGQKTITSEMVSTPRP